MVSFQDVEAEDNNSLQGTSLISAEGAKVICKKNLWIHNLPENSYARDLLNMKQRG
jgi:hypothetical protein